MTTLLFILIALLGLLIGILSGIFGIGGGIMIIPALNLVFNLSPLTSAATSLFVVAPTAISGTYRHLRQGKIDVRAALFIGLSGACASTVSSFFSGQIPGIIIIVIAACLIIYCAGTIIHNALRPGGDEDGDPKRSRFKSKPGLAVARIALGLFAGAMSGIVGLGGGFIIIPIAVSLLGYTFKQATAVSLFSVGIIALPGIIMHALLGHVAYLYGLALMLGTIPGANIGVRMAAKIPEKPLGLAFSALLIISGVMLVINQVLLDI
ncbi:MAG: sulfite exporter TauE/SafE family protein [Coriobacteriia bacterium]|nr:sulfite exporter TauE/SafE family protein [Coriobacteriia bacterium]